MQEGVEGGELFDGGSGEVWVALRGELGESSPVSAPRADILAARVEVLLFDGVRCLACRVVEEWTGVRRVDGSIDWLEEKGGRVWSVVVEDAWRSDSGGAADVASLVGGEFEGAIVLRMPMGVVGRSSVLRLAAWRSEITWWKRWGEEARLEQKGKDWFWGVQNDRGTVSATVEGMSEAVIIEAGWSIGTRSDEGERVVFDVQAGWAHTCVLLSGGGVRCWGYGVYGRLGYGNTGNIGDDELPSSAGDVSVGGEVVQISAGSVHTCALLSGGGVRCWGDGVYGQMGYGNTEDIGDDELPFLVGGVALSSSRGTAHLWRPDIIVSVSSPSPSRIAVFSAPLSLFQHTEISSIDCPGLSVPFPPLPFSTSLSIDSAASAVEMIAACPFPSLTTLGSVSLCIFPPPLGSPLAAGAFVPSRVGVDAAPLNAAGGSMITFSGELSYLLASGGATVLVDGRTCASVVAVVDGRSFSCEAPPGIGANVSVMVSSAFLPASLSPPLSNFSVSYFPPSISSINPPFNLPVLGDTPIAIAGANFGPPSVHSLPSTLSVTIDGLECSDVKVSSDNLVECMAPAGVGNREVQVVSGGQASNIVVVPSSPPSLTSVSPSYLLLGDVTTVTLEGSNLALVASDVDSVLIGGLACEGAVVVRDGEAISCLLDSSSTTVTSWPSPREASITIGGQSTTVEGLFEGMAAPSIAAVAPLTPMPTRGDGRLRIVGGGFGGGLEDVRGVFVGGRPGIVSSWDSELQLEVTVPAGAGEAEVVVVSRTGLRSNSLSTSYSPPSITSISPTFVPTLSPPTNLSLSGVNFPWNVSGRSLEVVLGGLVCESVEVLSVEVATCVLDSSSPYPDPSNLTVATTSQSPTAIPSNLFSAIPAPTLAPNCIPTGVIRGSRARLRGEWFGVDVDGEVEGLVGRVEVNGVECGGVEVLSGGVLECVVSSSAWADEDEVDEVAVQVWSTTGARSGTCMARRPRFEEQDWAPRGVVGWRDVGDETHVSTAWKASETELSQLSGDAVFVVEVDDLTNSDPPSTEEVGIMTHAAEEVLPELASRREAGVGVWSLVLTVAQTAVRVRVRAVTSIGERSRWSSWTDPIYASCEEDKYLNDASGTSWEDRVCVPCPLGGLCGRLASSSRIRQERGSWRLSAGESEEAWGKLGPAAFSPCLVEGVCVEEAVKGGGWQGRVSDLVLDQSSDWSNSTTTSTTTTLPSYSSAPCAPLHYGTLCSLCVERSFRDVSGRCRQCSNTATAWFLLFLYTCVMLLLFTAFTVYILLRDDSSVHIEDSSSYLSLVMAHVQSLSVVIQAVPGASWPVALAEFFSVFSVISLPGFSELSQCVLGSSSQDPATLVSLRAIVFPVVLMLFSALLWLVWDSTCGHVAKRLAPRLARARSARNLFAVPQERSAWWTRYRKHVTTTLVILATLVHKPITEAGFSLLRCVSIAPDTIPPHLLTSDASAYASLRLVSNLDMKCGGEGRSVLAAFVLVCGSLGIPLGILYLLVRHSADISRLMSASASSSRASSFLWDIRFLFDSYRPQFYFFEVVQMAWAVILVMVVSLTGSAGPTMQFQAAIAVKATELISVSWLRPFNLEPLNRLLSLTSFVMIFSLLLGTVFIRDLEQPIHERMSEGAVVVLVLLVVLGNVGIVVYGVLMGLRVLRAPLEAWLRRMGVGSSGKGFHKTPLPPSPTKLFPSVPLGSGSWSHLTGQPDRDRRASRVEMLLNPLRQHPRRSVEEDSHRVGGEGAMALRPHGSPPLSSEASSPRVSMGSRDAMLPSPLHRSVEEEEEEGAADDGRGGGGRDGARVGATSVSLDAPRASVASFEAARRCAGVSVRSGFAESSSDEDDD